MALVVGCGLCKIFAGVPTSNTLRFKLMGEAKTFGLIHGSWLGPESWYPVRMRLGGSPSVANELSKEAYCESMGLVRG